MGKYILSVSADGFRTSEQEVVVTAWDVWITAVLDLDPIDLQIEILLSGRVKSSGVSRQQGVRVVLVSVFWNFRSEAVVSSDNQFKFAGLKAGKYLLIITEGSGISKLQPVDIQAVNEPLVIETSSQAVFR